MNEEEIRKIMKERNFDNEKFIIWIQKRFPVDLYPSYLNEWIDRFQNANPESCMDSYSLTLWKSVKMNNVLRVEIK